MKYKEELLTLIHYNIDYLDYVPRIGNARFIWIIRVGAHPNNSWSTFEDNSPITPLFASWTLFCMESVSYTILYVLLIVRFRMFLHWGIIWKKTGQEFRLGFRTCTGHGRLYISHRPVAICLRLDLASEVSSLLLMLVCIKAGFCFELGWGS